MLRSSGALSRKMGCSQGVEVWGGRGKVRHWSSGDGAVPVVPGDLAAPRGEMKGGRRGWDGLGRDRRSGEQSSGPTSAIYKPYALGQLFFL